MLVRSLKNLKNLISLRKNAQIFKYSTPLNPHFLPKYNFSVQSGSNSNSSTDLPDSIKNLINQHGEKHISVINAYQDLMNQSTAENKLSEAIKFGNKALELLQAVEKPGSVNQISLLNNLACIKKLAGQIQECLDDFKKAIDIFERNPSQDAKEPIITVRHSLSSVLQELGLFSDSFKEAKKCHEEAVDYFGNDHPTLVGIKFLLSKSLLNLGMQNDSLKYLEESLFLAEKTGQLNTLLGANIEISIGEMLLRTAKGTEAEPHIRSAERICNKIGEKGELLMKVHSSLGHLLSLTNVVKSLESFESALKIAEKLYTKPHPNLAMIYFNIAEAYKSNSNYEDAIKFHEKSFDIVKKFFGPDHPKAVNYHTCIGLVYQEMGDPWKGVTHLERSKTIKEKQFGENHFETAQVNFELALCYFDCKEYNKALECLNKVIPIFEANLPPYHNLLTNALRHLGTTYNRLGNTDKALEYLQKSLNQTRKQFGNRDPNVPDCLNNMGLIKAKLKRFDEGLKDLEESLKLRQEIFGNDNVEVAQSYVNVAGVKIVKEDYDTAHDLYAKAELIYAKNYGPDHYFIGNILNNRGRIYHKQGDMMRALECLERGRALYAKTFGPEHIETQNIVKLIEEIKKSS